MKKLSSFLKWILWFFTAYLIDLAYIPVYATVAGTLGYIYAMFCEVMNKPFILPLWKLGLLLLAGVYFIASTIVNIVTIITIRKRLENK